MLIWEDIYWTENDIFAELKLFSIPTGHFRGEYSVITKDSSRNSRRLGPLGTPIGEDWEEVMIDLYTRAYYDLANSRPY